MKVLKAFYCIQTKKNYNIGDDYDGTRTDIVHLLDIEVKEPKVVKAKNKK